MTKRVKMKVTIKARITTKQVRVALRWSCKDARAQVWSRAPASVAKLNNNRIRLMKIFNARIIRKHYTKISKPNWNVDLTKAKFNSLRRKRKSSAWIFWQLTKILVFTQVAWPLVIFSLMLNAMRFLCLIRPPRLFHSTSLLSSLFQIWCKVNGPFCALIYTHQEVIQCIILLWKKIAPYGSKNLLWSANLLAQITGFQ